MEAQIAVSNGKQSRDLSTVFHITSVTRPLWSVSKILDNLSTQDPGAEVVFKRDRAEVKGSSGTVYAVAERRGGLYIGTVKLKNPRSEGFGRPGP